jgi:prepilin-type N-terminal cleavage/methylation domain-containing protein
MHELTPVRRCSSEQSQLQAFTLVELLVAVAILALLLGFVMRLLSGTSATVTASNKQIETASLARIALDRFGADFSGAVLNGGATALHYSESGDAGNSTIGFVSTSRARGPTTQTNPWTFDTRSAFVGYRVRLVAQNIGVNIGTPSLPCLNRGDGRFTLSKADISSNLASYNLWDVFGTGSLRMPNDLTANNTADSHILNWQVIGNAILRLHVTFVLDNGAITQTPPMYRNFFSNGGMGTTGCVPIAFSRETSADANKRYVKGLIVGVAVLDEATRNLAYRIDNNFATTMGNKIKRPTQDGETPVEVWSQNLRTFTSSNATDANYLFPPMRENLRFYQQFYSVNL